MANLHITQELQELPEPDMGVFLYKVSCEKHKKQSYLSSVAA